MLELIEKKGSPVLLTVIGEVSAKGLQKKQRIKGKTGRGRLTPAFMKGRSLEQRGKKKQTEGELGKKKKTKGRGFSNRRKLRSFFTGRRKGM